MFKRGPEFTILRPICWLFGHGVYHASGEGWSHTKHVCPVCGVKIPRTPTQNEPTD